MCGSKEPRNIQDAFGDKDLIWTSFFEPNLEQYKACQEAGTLKDSGV